jgi:hypothetical protein
MQVPIQLQLQQIARIVAKSTRFRGFGANKAQRLHLQSVNKRIQYAAYMIGGNKIIQNHWKQCSLPPPIAFDIAHKKCPRFRKGIFSLL